MVRDKLVPCLIASATRPFVRSSARRETRMRLMIGASLITGATSSAAIAAPTCSATSTNIYLCSGSSAGSGVDAGLAVASSGDPTVITTVTTAPNFSISTTNSDGIRFNGPVSFSDDATSVIQGGQ